MQSTNSLEQHQKPHKSSSLGSVSKLTLSQAQMRGRILIADDDDPFRKCLVAVLQRQGYACEEARNASEALAKLSIGQFDLLLSDIYMPGNENLELVKTVSQSHPFTPIVLFTGQPSVETAAKSVRHAVAAYLVKPPATEELLQIVDSQVAQSQRRRAISAARHSVEQWSNELRVLEEEMAAMRGPNRGETGADFVQVGLFNIARQLIQIAQVSHLSPQTTGDNEQLLPELMAALQHTVTVLENTRHHFKSSELAALRRQLSSLIETPRFR